ncbi:hypothetical protein ACFLUA_01410 [Chloroflexota bacterium]
MKTRILTVMSIMAILGYDIYITMLFGRANLTLSSNESGKEIIKIQKGLIDMKLPPK